MDIDSLFRKYEDYMARELSDEISDHRTWVEAQRQNVEESFCTREISRLRRYERWGCFFEHISAYSLMAACFCFAAVLVVSRFFTLPVPLLPFLVSLAFLALALVLWAYPKCILANRLYETRKTRESDR